MTRSECPSQHELQSLATGRTVGDDVEALAEHVASCRRCAAAFESLPIVDPLLHTLRDPEPVESADAAELAALVGWLDSMGSRAGDESAYLTNPTPQTFGVETIRNDGAAVRDLFDAPHLPDEIGRIGHYRVLEVVGHGGMGVVLRAEDVRLRRTVAIKLIRDVRMFDTQYLTRFEQEGKAIARLQHPNIVRVYEVGCHRDRPYLVLEYVAGGTLAARIDGQPQPIQSSAQFVVSLARAIEHAHENGVVHRDLKPANVLLEGSEIGVQGSGSRLSGFARANACSSLNPEPRALNAVPKITDFGLAKHIDEQGVTQTGDVLGTPSYMAPELTRGLQGDGLNERLVDVYSLGAILFEMLTGRPPFRGATVPDTFEQVRTLEPLPPHRLRPDVPRDLETICLKCLAKEPGRRYASAGALADDLERHLAGEPIHARAAGVWEHGWKWARRKPAAASLAAVSILALATLTTGGWIVNLRLNDAVRRTRSEQQRAETNVRRLKETVNSMLWRSADELAEIPETEALRQRLVQEASELYANVADDELGRDLDALCNHAQLIWELAIYHDSQGQNALALDLYEDTLRRQRRVRDMFPDEARSRHEMAMVQINYGQFLERLGRFYDAEAAFEESIRLLDTIPAEIPDGPWFEEAYLGLAVRHARSGRLATAESHFRTARMSIEASMSKPRYGSMPSWYRQALYADALRLEGLFVYDTGRSSEAEALIHKAIEILQPIARDEPGHRRLQSYLGPAYLALGVVSEESRPGESKTLYRQALTIGEQLSGQFPRTIRYEELLAEARERLAASFLRNGETSEAQRLLFAARAMRERQMEQQPEVPSYPAARAEVLNHLGTMYRGDGRHDQAEVALNEALGIAELLCSKYPDETAYALILAASHQNLGELQHVSTAADQAVKHVLTAIHTLEAILNGNPRHPRANQLLREATATRDSIESR